MYQQLFQRKSGRKSRKLRLSSQNASDIIEIYVVLSLEAYSRLTDGIEAALDMADKAAEEDDIRYTHEEVFSNLRRRVNG